MDFTNSHILCIFAHPDDESYIVGGTLALASAQRASISLISLTRGDKGTQHVDDPFEKHAITETREQELRDSCQILGINELILWDYPDGGVDQAPEQGIIEQLVQEIERIKPSLIITFGVNGVSRHRDHIVTGALTVKAARACAERRRKGAQNGAELKIYGVTIPEELISYFDEVFSHRKRTMAHYHDTRATISPKLSEVEAVDIASVLEIKFAACRAHKSQNPEGLIEFYQKLPPGLLMREYYLSIPLS